MLDIIKNACYKGGIKKLATAKARRPTRRATKSPCETRKEEIARLCKEIAERQFRLQVLAGGPGSAARLGIDNPVAREAQDAERRQRTAERNMAAAKSAFTGSMEDLSGEKAAALLKEDGASFELVLGTWETLEDR